MCNKIVFFSYTYVQKYRNWPVVCYSLIMYISEGSFGVTNIQLGTTSNRCSPTFEIMCTWRYRRSNWYLNEQQWRHGIDPVVFHHDSLSNVIQLDPAGHTSVIDDDVESFSVQRRLNRLHQTWVFRRVSYICSQSSTPYYNKQGLFQDVGRRRVHQGIWGQKSPSRDKGQRPVGSPGDNVHRC